MGASAYQLPNPSVVTAPLMLIQHYEPVAHPNLSRLQARARRAVAMLRSLGGLRLDVTWNLDESGDEERLARTLELLHSLRYVDEHLRGFSVRRFSSELRKHGLGVQAFDEAVSAALENVREMRAHLALFVGEHDDEELGIEVIPPPLEGVPPRGPSVDFEW